MVRDNDKTLAALQTIVQDDQMTNRLALYLNRAAHRAKDGGDAEAVFNIAHHRGAVVGALADARDELRAYMRESGN